MKKEANQEEVDRSLKLIFKSSIFVFLGIVLSKVLSYLYRIVIARDFGPEVYGIFSLATMILLFLVSFANLGLVEGILRFVSFYRGKNNINKIRYVFRFSLYALFFSSILVGIILFLFADFISLRFFHNPNLIIYLRIFSVLVPFYIFLYSFLSVIQAYEKIKVYSFILDFLENFLKLIFLLILIFLGFVANAIIFSYILGVISVFLAAFLYCKYRLPEIFKKYTLSKKSEKDIKKKLISYSWPLVFSTLLYVLFSDIDSFCIGFFKDVTQVGIYNAAVPIAALMVFSPVLFLRLFFPIITREFSKKNTELIKELSKQVQKWIMIVNVPLLFLIVLFPGAFINILFGSEYITAENSLRFLAIGFFFNSLCLIFYNLISMVGKSKLILLNILITAILNIIINISLIPVMGITGAAIGTMISYFVLMIIFFFQVRHYLSIIPLKKEMYGVILSATIPLVLLIFLKQLVPYNLLNLFLLVLFYGLSYLLLIFLTKSLDDNDLMILSTLKNKFFKK